jgi:hypothetical protein
MLNVWGDFRPISLTHSVAKLLSKLLANRLAPELNDLSQEHKVLSSKGAFRTTFSIPRT